MPRTKNSYECKRVRTRINGTSLERFQRMYKVVPGGCWMWMHLRTHLDYGRFCFEGKWRLAHRVGYQLLKGPIPDGLTLDHLCRNTWCVNPDHMDPVTQKENNLRGNSLAAWRARQTHCKRGHAFDEANTYRDRSSNRRYCIACRAVTGEAWRSSPRGKAIVTAHNRANSKLKTLRRLAALK